jgi:hypothetical protein
MRVGRTDRHALWGGNALRLKHRPRNWLGNRLGNTLWHCLKCWLRTDDWLIDAGGCLRVTRRCECRGSVWLRLRLQLRLGLGNRLSNWLRPLRLHRCSLHLRRTDLRGLLKLRLRNGRRRLVNWLGILNLPRLHLNGLNNRNLSGFRIDTKKAEAIRIRGTGRNDNCRHGQKAKPKGFAVQLTALHGTHYTYSQHTNLRSASKHH